jgi:MATE family multidrug resistance protein
MGWIGKVPLAAHGIVLNIASITFMLHLGLSNVATIRVGNALGRKDLPHLRKGAVTVMALSVLMAAATAVAFIALPEPLINLFMDSEEAARDEILKVGIVLLALAALFQLVDGAQVVALGLLRGAQDTTMPMYFAAFSYWFVGLPTAYVLGFTVGWGGAGVWLGLSLGLAAAAILLNWRFWKVTLPRKSGAEPKA